MARQHLGRTSRWLIDSRHTARRRRRYWSFEPCLGWLEARRLLAGSLVPGLSAQVTPLPLDSPVVGKLAQLETNDYQVSSDNAGKLTVTLTASPLLSARVALMDSTGATLVQSDGSASGAGLIDVNVPAGSEYIAVQSLVGAGTYQLTADLVPTTGVFQPIASEFHDYGAIAVGDFLGNGINDLVVPDGIYLGVGDGTFQSTPIDGPLGQAGWTVTAITVGDFTGHSLPDIAFAETSPLGNQAELWVLQNEGNGQFNPVGPFDVDSQAAAALGVYLDPVAVQAIDFGGGGVDLAVADETTGNVSIFVGNGAGGFSTGPVLEGLNAPCAMVAGQFGDGHVDLIVANQGDPSVGLQGLTVFQAKGPGKFQYTETIAVDSSPSALAAGDFTGSGVLDLAVVEPNADQVSVYLNTGDGTFDAPATYEVGANPQSIVAADFGNGHVDLATANENSDNVSVLLGNGDGTFQPDRQYAPASSPGALVTADFNGDNRADLAVASPWDPGGISVLLGHGDGTFQDPATNYVGDGPDAAAAADLNNDGNLDIITANATDNTISVLLGNGDGTFQTAESFPAGSAPTGLVVGDFNGDGLLDVAVADGGDGDSDEEGVSILLGNGDGTLQSPIFYATGGYPSSIVGGDFTGNGLCDLALTMPGSNEVLILLSNGLGGFSRQLTIPLGNEAGFPVSIVTGDFLGGGSLDLAVLNGETGNISILKGYGNGDFQLLPRRSVWTFR